MRGRPVAAALGSAEVLADFAGTFDAAAVGLAAAVVVGLAGVLLALTGVGFLRPLPRGVSAQRVCFVAKQGGKPDEEGLQSR